MSPRLLRLLVGIDARRPASWIALAVGAAAGWWAVVTGPHAWLVGVACGTSVLVAAAAVGDLPVELCRGSACIPPARLAAVWGMLRAAWPLVGAATAACLASGAEAFPAAPAVAAVLAGGMTVAAVVVARAARATAADAAAVALAIGGAGAAAGLAFGLAVGSSGGGGWEAVAASAAGWCLAAAVAVVAWRTFAEADAVVDLQAFAGHPPGAVPAIGWERLHLDPLPAVGPVQGVLERLAMASTLVAMAGWLILRPDLVPESGHGAAAPAWPWALLSAVWYVCLAVPRATLLDGACGTAAWERLFLSAAGPATDGPGRIRGLTAGRVGGPRFAAVAALVPAAILGWPPLVGGLVSSTSPSHGWPPLAITAGLAFAAVALATLTMAGTRTGAARETLFAVALAFAVTTMLAAAGLP
jgi:hypothetical protein